MVSIEDFIVKRSVNNNGGSKVKDLYLAKIGEKSQRTLRLLEDRGSNGIKKYVPMHGYLEGIHSSPCININKDNGCLFCKELTDVLNTIYKDHFDWLYSLDIVDKAKTDEANKTLAAEQKPKLIFKNGKIVELEKTFDKDVVSLLDDKNSKIYYAMLNKEKFAKYKKAGSKFYAPVYDYATKDVKIYVFSSSVWNQIESAFTKLGKNFTSADFMITCNAVSGNYWSVSRDDANPMSEEIQKIYAAKKEVIMAEIEKKTKLPTLEEQKKMFEFYRKTVDSKGQSEEEESTPTSVTPAGAQAAKDLLGEIFS